MPMNVKMPDGTIVQNVPDGTTRSQLMARYEKFASSKSITSSAQPSLPDAPNVATNAKNSPVAKPDESLMGRIQKDIGQRFKTGVDIMGNSNEQNPLSTGLQMGGKVVAGTAGDIAGEVAKSAYDVLPESIKANIQNDPITRAAVIGAKTAGEVYNKLASSQWAKQHPEAFANMESLATMAGSLPAAKAVGVAGKQVIRATPVLGPVAKGMEVPAVKGLKKEANAKTMAAGKGIQEAKEAGIVIDPVASNKFSAEIGKIVDETNPTKANASNATLDTIKRIQANIDRGDTSFDNLIIERNELQKARSLGGEEGLSAGKAMEALDKHIGEVYTGDKVVGGSKADIKKYQDKMVEYGEAKRNEKIVSILNDSQGNSTVIKNKMGKLVKSDDFKFYSKDVQKLIQNAASGKTSQNVLDVSAKLMNKLPVVGPLTGMVIGGAAKKISGTIAKGTVGDILEAIKKGK